MVTRTESNLIGNVIADHRHIEGVFKELLDPGTARPRRRALTAHVIAELVRHAAVEERYLYPVVRELLVDGDEVADREIAEHAEAETVMRSLECLDVGDPRFTPHLENLVRIVRHHIGEEERVLLPKLGRAGEDSQLRDLGRMMTRAKDTAPTCPHPDDSDPLPAGLAAEAGAGLIDRIRGRMARREA